MRNIFLYFWWTELQVSTIQGSCTKFVHQQLTSLNNTTYSSAYLHPYVTFFSSLSSFNLPIVAEISGLICKSQSSTCQLDPLPTHLVTEEDREGRQTFTNFIHSPLISGLVPSSLKTAAITPILEKPGADPNNLNNFLPRFKFTISLQNISENSCS